jgi:beta-phosphoglucomutase-like phosphatase (HAD superfamily)
MSEHDEPLVIRDAKQLHSPATRRGFLRALGLGGTVVLLPSVFAACEDSTGSTATTEVNAAFAAQQTVTLNLGTDVGIINYAYALEQLEAAFYQQAVAASAFSGMPAAEQELLTDIRNHEVIHRDFIRAALGSAAIPNLAVNFGTSLNTRDSILNTAKVLEDTGVAAYNGAGRYLQDARNLLLAGKIVSVEARHAAAVRDVLDTTGVAFAGDDIVDPATALDRATPPSGILSAVGATGFVTTRIAIGTPPVAR